MMDTWHDRHCVFDCMTLFIYLILLIDTLFGRRENQGKEWTVLGLLSKNTFSPRSQSCEGSKIVKKISHIFLNNQTENKDLELL